MVLWDKKEDKTGIVVWFGAKVVGILLLLNWST